MTQTAPPPVPQAGTWHTLSRTERQTAAFGTIAIAALLTVAAILTPDERGVGTHTQLGLPPCATENLLGVPCPFCGMTTSFSHMAHGEVQEAFVAQPAGALGFVVASVLGLVFVVGLATGKMPGAFKRLQHAWWPYVFASTIIAVAWAYKVLTHTGLI
jgi:hypothetical protein